MGLLVDGDRFKAIIACAAEPEERRPTWTAFNPVGSRDQLAALGTGISTRQIAEIRFQPLAHLPSDFVMHFLVVE